ncbi:hypothetical protein ACFRFL_45450 [Streptomyces sp. NPDC056708]|uniref:hypothetical protein n=1 Tax=unclassified Streptomyces TaxID=2593676 RepID=UPI0036A49AAE
MGPQEREEHGQSGPQAASTDQQSTARQNLVLAEAGIEDPVTFEVEAGTSSRLHPVQRRE